MEAFLLCNRLFIGLSFPLHSLSPLANPSCPNLVVLTSSQFQPAGCGYTCFVDALEGYVQFHIRKLFVCSYVYFVACFFSLFFSQCYFFFFCYFFVPIQVHLCHIVSNGPCLCLDSHHLQNLTCARKRIIPIIRLRVYPQ